MARLNEIVSFANELLNIDHFDDYCPIGLQVQGKSKIEKIVSGVTASQALLDGAVKEGADLVLVHHGFFWRGESEVITGIKHNRIKTLIMNDINLLAYHLPLDAHPEYGNNVTLARKLGLSNFKLFGKGRTPIAIIAQLDEPIFCTELLDRIRSISGREPMHLGAKPNKKIQSVALCTGGAQNYFEEAIANGADVFITGEVSEQNYHIALESGVDFIAAGHHATERYGVQALGELLARQFSVQHKYLDLPNPV